MEDVSSWTPSAARSEINGATPKRVRLGMAKPRRNHEVILILYFDYRYCPFLFISDDFLSIGPTAMTSEMMGTQAPEYQEWYLKNMGVIA